ncbi:MAG: hypothetical protein EZS28_000728 [Streblomastix strix]|uniref:Uncharacterized protein n=1 Tax=Streblomastix strix TaxID=222440 RepID=A0A5J4X911_9EUKA|nr:MAG: hypothetical protein EZS28_000728 [Streblomastix strix]
METVGGNGFNNVCFKQNLVDAPVLWGQNMISQECFIGQNKSVVFTLYDNFGRKVPTAGSKGPARSTELPTSTTIASIASTIIATTNGYHIGGSIKELIDFHVKGHRNCLRTARSKYNICWFYAYNIFKYPDTPEKRIKEHSREHIAKEHMAKFYDVNEAADESSDETINEPVEVPEFNNLQQD